MTIENPSEYLRNLWDWSVLDGCFGETKIKPTDIDGFIERNGKFLAIETKSPGVDLNVGQLITFRSLVKTGYFTVAVVWGNPGSPTKILLMTRRATLEYSSADLAKFRWIVSEWFSYADNKQTAEGK